MNTQFYILWYEDDQSWRRASKNQIEEVLLEHNLNPVFTYKTGADVSNEHLWSNEFDLILMDFKLANGSDGGEIIKSIRSIDILTDILFYSASYQEMLGVIKEDPENFTGVYFSDRGDSFDETTERLILKIIRRSEDIVNLRGMVMDNTSEFEYKMKNIIIKANSIFTSDEKKKVNEKVKKQLNKSQDEMGKKVSEICSADCPVTSAINSKSYILDSWKKIILIQTVTKLLKSRGLILPMEYEKLAEKFRDDLLCYRNALGHVSKIDREINIGTEENPQLIPIDSSLYVSIRKNILGFQSYFSMVEDFLDSL